MAMTNTKGMERSLIPEGGEPELLVNCTTTAIDNIIYVNRFEVWGLFVY